MTQVDGTLIEKSHNDFIANNTLKNNSISTSILNDDLSDNVVFENTSAKKKDARKSGLPFVRIFKNKKDSNAIPSKQNNTSSNSKIERRVHPIQMLVKRIAAIRLFQINHQGQI